jgi:hypothetical protein
MDINDQLQSIVAGLIGNLKTSLEQELQDKISKEVVAKVANTELDSIISKQIEAELASRLEKFNFADTSKAHLTKLTADITKEIGDNIGEQARNQVTSEVARRLALIDLGQQVDELVKSKLESIIKLNKFPERSIPHTSIQFDKFTISGNVVKGGIISNFSSTGIEDLTTKVQMTLMDQAVAFEGPVWAPSANIKGKLVVDGDLIVNGEMPTDCNAFIKIVDYSADKVRTLLNTELFTGFSDIIYKQIAEKGIDLDKITQSGKEIVKGSQLGYHIVDTNIQRLGMVRDFQTTGENLLTNTLYVTNKRVGINTIDPSTVFVIWDEEVEMIVTKRRQDVGFIGSQRRQAVILGSNNKDNIVLTPEGTVEIENLSVGNVPMTSAAVIPNYEAITGTIVWNEAPSLGGPMGWVCLGGTRWAKFGKIE